MTAAKTAAKTAQAKTHHPKQKAFTQRAKYTDGKKNTLEVRVRQVKDGSFQLVAFHTKVGQKKQRGCLAVLPTQEQAVARMAELTATAEKNGWHKVMSSTRSYFDTIPMAEA